jgi:hypothetical protein
MRVWVSIHEDALSSYFVWRIQLSSGWTEHLWLDAWLIYQVKR